MTVTETATCLTKEGSLHSRTLDPGTLIIANSGATLGVAKLLGIKCCANDGIAALLNLSKDVSAAYLAHFINTKTSYLRDVVATGNGQPNLNTGLIGRFKFPLPPTKAEQEAIAETLSDVDGLIEALEKLIAKKRAIKQAAMQQLLTGQTRLPGFSGEWRTSTFDELFGILRSANNSRADLSSEGDCGYLHYGDIHTHSSVFLDCGRELKTFIASNRVHGTPDMQDGDLVMVDASEDTDAIGKAVEITGLRGRKAVAGLHTILLRGRLGQLSDGFKGYLQYFAQVRHSLVRMATGVSVYGISKSAIKKIAVTIPDVEEQAAIAAVLSAMDAEITALERRRDKTKAIKQGMMQQLLTGRVRLLKPEAPAAKPEPLRKPANAPTWQLSEEVLISVLAKQFGSEKFPLGRMRRMKLTYLLRRHLEGQAQGYLKKAAGPYNPKSKYGGPETIALRKGYVREQKSGNLQGFVAGKNIAQADACFDEWYGPEARQWLEQFRLKKNEELELLATVDMAAEELREKGVEVSLATVKDVIQAGPEWKAKLARDVFSDRNIALAIDACRTLFG
jgi:type I restriction enzyme S subunit